jgi:periplasmic divalent cation tolerance protein
VSEGCFCWVSCRDREEALRIGRAVVGERLAACANLLGGMTSVYRWKGKVEEGPEFALVLKTRVGLAERLVARVGELHGYECSGVVVLPIAAGNPDYLRWLADETEG